MKPFLTVLNYHGLESREGEYSFHHDERAYVLPAEVFERHLDLIRSEGGRVLSSHEAFSPSLAEKAVLLTFDDGLSSHAAYAAPAMKVRGMTGIFFVSAGKVGLSGYMDWHELRALAADGFEIGAHGYDHVPLPPLADGALLRETAEAKKKLEDGLGSPVRSFSVPRGFYSGRVGRFVRQAGYQNMFTSHFGVNPVPVQPFYVKRLAPTRFDAPETLGQWLRADFGSRHFREEIKERLRRLLGPGIYDHAARLKAAARGPGGEA